MAQEGQQRALAYNLLAVPGCVVTKAHTEKREAFCPVSIECPCSQSLPSCQKPRFPFGKIDSLMVK